MVVGGDAEHPHRIAVQQIIGGRASNVLRAVRSVVGDCVEQFVRNLLRETEDDDFGVLEAAGQANRV